MVLSAILEKEPEPVRSLRPAATPELERLIASCLEKDPERRWQSAHDLAVQLHALPTRSGMTAGRRGASRREAAAWSLAILALLALPGGWLYLRPGESVPRRALYRTSVLPPPGVTFSPHHFAVSPDGTRLAFAAFDENGRTALWIRSLVSGGVQQVPETDDAQYPLQLRVADLATGAIRPVVEAPSGRGAAWNRGGDIVYAPTVDGPMFRVSEHGGPPQQATRLDPQSSGAHRWPWFLPDGRRFLYVDEWGRVSVLQASTPHRSTVAKTPWSRVTSMAASRMAPGTSSTCRTATSWRSRSMRNASHRPAPSSPFCTAFCGRTPPSATATSRFPLTACSWCSPCRSPPR